MTEIRIANGACSMCGSPGPIGSVCDRCPCAYTRAATGPTCDDCGAALDPGSEDPTSGIKLCSDAPHGCQARRAAAVDLTNLDDEYEACAHCGDVPCSCLEHCLAERKFLLGQIEALQAFVKRVHSECRNELARGEIQGFAHDGPHATLWTGLRDEARALLAPCAPEGACATHGRCWTHSEEVPCAPDNPCFQDGCARCATFPSGSGG